MSRVKYYVIVTQRYSFTAKLAISAQRSSSSICYPKFTYWRDWEENMYFFDDEFREFCRDVFLKMREYHVTARDSPAN